jgi:hypothetical protein
MKLSFQADRPGEQNSIMFNSAREIMLQAAIIERVISDDDLAMVPEVMPLFFRLAGEVRNDMFDYLKGKGDSQLIFPVMQNCFYYCFGKGAESAYLWNKSADGKVEYLYSPNDAIAGRVGVECSEDFRLRIEGAKLGATNTSCRFGNEVFSTPNKYPTLNDKRCFADWAGCGLYWCAAIGLDFGMNQLGLP